MEIFLVLLDVGLFQTFRLVKMKILLGVNFPLHLGPDYSLYTKLNQVSRLCILYSVAMPWTFVLPVELTYTFL